MNGLIAATYAPMHADSSINLGVISEYGQFLKNNKIKGAFVNGSTGDFVSLSTKERKEIITEWSNTKPKDFFLVNHVGHNSLLEAKDLATHSADKVNAIAALAPYYFRLSSLKSLLEYCKEIAACAPATPFYYYHIPVLTGANFLMHEFLEMASQEIPNFAGIKFTNNNLIDYKYCKDFNNGAYNILFGFDEILLASLPMGADGWVGSTYNHLAPLYLSIIEAFKNNDHTWAATLQEKSMKFVDILNAKGGFNGAAKSFMKVLGVDCGPSRFPHITLTAQELEQVEKELAHLGIMDHANK